MSTKQYGEDVQAIRAERIVYVVQSPDSIESATDVKLRELLPVIWRRKWWILGFAALLTALSIAYVVSAPRWYRAEVVVIARDGAGEGGIPAQFSQFGGLANAMGISLGGGDKEEPLAILRSKGFAGRFIKRNDLVGALSESSNGLLSGFIPRAHPDTREVVESFVRTNMSVIEDKKTGLITVRVEWTNAEKAAEWANSLIRQINDETRQRALQDAERNIQYLKEQWTVNDSVSLQSAIGRLIESEMQKVMIAKGSDEYSFRMIDEARPPSRPARPNRKLIVFLTFLVGILVATAGVVAVTPLKQLAQALRS